MLNRVFGPLDSKMVKKQKRTKSGICVFIKLCGTISDPPKVTSHPQGTTIIEGKTLNLTCLATGKPEPIITWFKDGHLIKGKSNGILVIIKTKRTEDGTYQCFANNTVGADRSSTARVNVLCKYRYNFCNMSIHYFETRTKCCTLVGSDI